MVELSWAVACVALICAPLLCFAILRCFVLSKRPSKFTVAFFHPYCNDGGGGERVLWRAIDALQRLDKENKIDIVVFSGDSGVTGQDILNKAQMRFGITLEKSPRFIFLKSRHWVEASRYPFLTMLGQSLGSIVLAFEALLQLAPHVYIDTMGYSWTFPFFYYFARSTVSAYVHYPTISLDMTSAVSDRTSSVNNAGSIASSAWKTKLKLKYYDLFASLYTFMGRYSSLTMVNSSWTKSHIDHLWGPSKSHLIYPPCDTRGLQQLPMSRKNRREIVSIAQFRPEKNHFLQVEIMDELIHKSSEANRYDDVKLYMIGSLRVGNAADEALVARLKAEIAKRRLDNNVFILTGVSMDVLKQHYASASIGLHTMSMEHFGIGVVELQASGVVPIAHNSAGPKLDIVVPGTGRLASSAQEYKEALVELLEMPQQRFEEMANKARENAMRFSDEVFIAEINSTYLRIPSLSKALERP